MEKTGLSVVLSALTLLLLSLGGCGGGDSPAAETSTPVQLGGVVEDGPIENVTITLRDATNIPLSLCGPQWSDPCETKTNAEGAFSLVVKAGTQFADLGMVAGGIDFVGPEFRTPLALYSDDLTKIVISPLTTVVTELRDQGLSLSVAQDRVRAWLDLPIATNLALSSGSSPELKRRAYLLREISLEMNTMQTFAHIGSEIIKQDAALLAADSTCNQNVMLALGLDLSAQTRIAHLQMDLALAQTVGSIDDAALNCKRKEMMAFFDASVKQMLVDSASFDPLNANYRENLRILTEATLQVAGSGSIPLGGTIPQRIVRYLLFTYQLRTWESLTLDPAVFAEKLALLVNDSWIGALARSRSLYSVVSPLLITELPGNDNQQRLAYFYGSDLSPHYQPEQLIGQVFDDAVNDAVLLKIIEGKANAGLIDETRAIIATQIVQSEPKAHAYRSLANALLKYNRLDEARSALDLARDLYRYVVVAHKGAASTSTTDVENLIATSNSYRKAGDLVNAENLLDDVAAIAQASFSSLSYGTLIIGIRDLADVYIAAGDLEAAALRVDLMHNYAGQTPAQEVTKGSNTYSYRSRIYYWSESAKRYADLGNRIMVLQVLDEIQALRAADGLQNLTEGETWFYIPNMVETLYRVGETQKALDLANSIPSTIKNGPTYRINAFKSVAIYEALQGNLARAFGLLDDLTYFPKVEDKLDFLTYYANRNKTSLSLVLIKAGLFGEARQVLGKAEGVLDGMTQSTNLVRIRNGYIKVAELYAMMQDTANASALLQKAESKIMDDPYKVSVMVDIALGYHKINQTNVTLSLLASAKALADINPGLCRIDVVPNPSTQEEAATLIYEKIVKAYEIIGEKRLVYETTVFSLLPNAKQIYTASPGTTNDALAVKECNALLRAVLYFQGAGYHEEAINTLADAQKLSEFKVVDRTIIGVDIADNTNLITSYLKVIGSYISVHDDKGALALALALPFATERNQAIQTLANAYIDRDDFPESAVATIDSDKDGQPDFFHPLANGAEIAASGLFLDDDSDGDGIVDILDLRPLFAD